jgi:hypothetical protein
MMCNARAEVLIDVKHLILKEIIDHLVERPRETLFYISEKRVSAFHGEPELRRRHRFGRFGYDPGETPAVR